MSSSQLSAIGSKRITVPTPSTWPDTRWPPTRSVSRIAFSRLTGPFTSRPTVRARLSRETSKSKPLALDARRPSCRRPGSRSSRRPRRRSRPSIGAFHMHPPAGVQAERLEMRDGADGGDDTGEHDCCPASSGAGGRPRTRARRRRSSPTRSTSSHCSPMRLSRSRDRRQVEQLLALPQQRRREVDQQLVDAAGRDQRAVELVPGLDVDLVELATAEFLQRRGQVDLADRDPAARPVRSRRPAGAPHAPDRPHPAAKRVDHEDLARPAAARPPG